jgi:hypothetical protein
MSATIVHHTTARRRWSVSLCTPLISRIYVPPLSSPYNGTSGGDMRVSRTQHEECNQIVKNLKFLRREVSQPLTGIEKRKPNFVNINAYGLKI